MFWHRTSLRHTFIPRSEIHLFFSITPTTELLLNKVIDWQTQQFLFGMLFIRGTGTWVRNEWLLSYKQSLLPRYIVPLDCTENVESWYNNTTFSKKKKCSPHRSFIWLPWTDPLSLRLICQEIELINAVFKSVTHFLTLL